MNTTEVQTPWGTKQIVDFNIHGLKVGAKDGQCPNALINVVLIKSEKLIVLLTIGILG